MNPSCAFCGGLLSYVYNMGEYPIYQCGFCGTGVVYPMPDKETLKKLYNGFHPNLNIKKMNRRVMIASSLFKELSLDINRNLNMLDIGGGGGLFCKAFEDLNYGIATYVDLDPQACQFARNKLKLKKVYNVDAMEMSEITQEKYDFIYCRHLIEHLTDPVNFISIIIKTLTKNGILVIQFPNGDSLEYLAYPHLNIIYRFKKIMKSNGFSPLKTFMLLLFGKMLHGMDPPRHLWAISKKGIASWTKQNRLTCKIDTRHLGDLPFSPGYFKRKSMKGKFLDFTGQQLLARIHGGTHMIVTLKNKQHTGR